ncbi:2-oxoglutarate-Fe(II) type oxidoreductase hxnY-like [Rhododendron vialii]|uniref:2-oxoglutarate-Fe(II) type oxidoreductase hxnY-like n=1 Tax=Rhododendron vialii TaxID=182163 RepID=UPI00265E2197|nr:2-oxoglutarate-Fe(II) type oxidoreductase hxnY-like [Rhododendron vialii]
MIANRKYCPSCKLELHILASIEGRKITTEVIRITSTSFEYSLLWVLIPHFPCVSFTTFCAYSKVAKAVARIIALALNLEIDYFDRQEMLGKPIATLCLLHYEGRISDPVKGIFGAGAHSDFGFITLLATDDNYGLQICKDKDAKPQQWEFVAPLKGEFIVKLVNLADMLERWSNCTFRSTWHRVLGNGQERYSIAYFVDPSHGCLVECLPTCQSQENPPKFPPIKFETYMLQRYKDMHADLNSYNK